MKPAHLAAQAAVVRMLYDPSFAEAVRRAPRETLPELPPALADELGDIDGRALRRDRDRAERTLGQLSAELPASTSLAVAESGRMATLLAFFRSGALHDALREGTSLVLALASYLQTCLTEGALKSPHLAAVLAVELASARARRSGDDPPSGERAAPTPETRYRRARGVEPVQVPAGTLATLQAIEQHRFRLGLVPAWALATDPPPLHPLPSLGPPTWLAAIAIAGQVSLVEIESDLAAVLVSLSSDQLRTRRAILADAALRAPGAAVEVALDTLVADELVLPAYLGDRDPG